MSKIELDKSWEDLSWNEPIFHGAQQGFISGCENFQQRAIEELEKEVKEAYKYKGVNFTGLKEAIEIIKNLKA